MIQIFPVPAKIKFISQKRDLTSMTWIVLPENAGFPLKKRVMEMAKNLSENVLYQPRVCAGIPTGGEILVCMQRKDGFPQEGYQISIKQTGAIQLYASGDPGFFYGMQTACQLLAEPSQVPCCEVKDSPALKERGYMLDVSRNKIPTMDTLKELIRSLAKLRYNSLQLYMEHTFAFSGHERVWANYSPFTSEEIMELDAFCQDYFIELVPNLNSFGHLERWLCHPEYKELAECDPPFYRELTDSYIQGVLYPSKKSLEFVDSLYAELLPNFTSRKLNIGCDETWELGKGRSAEACRKKGKVKVYLDFLKQLADKAEKRGFSVEFWGDIIMHNPELIKELPKGITALEWGYEANHPFEKDTLAFKKSGVDFIVCPGTSAWLSILGRTTNMLKNVSNALYYGCKNGAKGMLMTDWGDRGHHQYYPVSWPGIAMGGGCSWNPAAEHSEALLSYGISMAFLPGEEGIRLGKFLLGMGKICDNFENPCANSTEFARAMVMYHAQRKSKDSYLAKVKQSDIANAMKHMKRLLKSLQQNPFRRNQLINAELENALRMAIAANTFLGKACGGKWNRDNWLDEMRHIIMIHEQLWLARNRSGGLRESCQILQDCMENDPLSWTKR